MSRPLSDFVVCESCGFYRLKTEKHCGVRGCSQNPETEKVQKPKRKAPARSALAKHRKSRKSSQAA